MAAIRKRGEGAADGRKGQGGAGTGGAEAGGAEIGGASGEGGKIPGAAEALIDASSAISEEEQREILEQINGIAEKNRLPFSMGGGAGRGFRAKKRGALFPALVNAFALALLLGGFFSLRAMQGEADAHAREGTRVFSSAERALIDEIRREAGASLALQDMEIGAIMASLAEFEALLRELSGGGEEAAARSEIEARQAERRAELEQARRQRSLILDEARAEEAGLQARRDSRARERAQAEGARERGGEGRGDGGARGAGRQAAEAAAAAEAEELRAWRAAMGEARQGGERGGGRNGERGQGRGGAGEGGGAESGGAIGGAGESEGARGELARLREDRRAADALALELRGGSARRRIGELEGQMGALQEALGMDGEAPFEALLESVRLLARGGAGGAAGSPPAPAPEAEEAPEQEAPPGQQERRPGRQRA